MQMLTVRDGEGAPMATGDDVQAPVDQRADVADNVAEEGSAVLVLVGEGDDMINVVEDQGAVNVRVPGDDGGGAVEVPEGDAEQVKFGEGADVTKNDTSGDIISVKVDDEAELAKEIGPAVCPRTKEEIVMTKPERFAYGWHS